MRYLPLIVKLASALTLTLYLISLGGLSYEIDWKTVLILLSPVFLAGILVLILKLSR